MILYVFDGYDYAATPTFSLLVPHYLFNMEDCCSNMTYFYRAGATCLCLYLISGQENQYTEAKEQESYITTRV